MTEQVVSRADQLALVRKHLKMAFPDANFVTNDDANAATPMSVRAEWGNGRYVKAVRADNLSSTAQDFLSKAKSVLEPFQAANIPARHKPIASKV